MVKQLPLESHYIVLYYVDAQVDVEDEIQFFEIFPYKDAAMSFVHKNSDNWLRFTVYRGYEVRCD